MAKVKIHVIFWTFDCFERDVSGMQDTFYQLRFHKIKRELDEIFGAEIEVTGEGTPTRTGYLEVQIVGGKLLHSKKNGDGYVDTKAKMDKIVQGVRDALAAAKG